MRILFVTPRFPYPPLKGDTLRTYHQIRALSREHEISLLSLTDAPVQPDEFAQVAQLCSRLEVVHLPAWRSAVNMAGGLLSKKPLQVSFYHSAAFQRKLDALLAGGRFDLLHVTLIRMLPYIWERHDIPVVVDLIDSLGLNLEARRKSVSGPMHIAYEIEYQRVLEYERSAVDRFPALVVSSPADKQMLGREHISVIPNGVDLEKFAFHGQQGRETDTLVFTGNMGYGPNEEAVLWFTGEVWPLLRRKRPDLRFQVVGTNPSERVREAAQRTRNVQIVGRVPDVTLYLNKATISVCPMRSGSGIQNKLLEAMACGTPVVATNLANRGVGGAADRNLLLADTPSDFAREVVRLLDDTKLRTDLAEAGRAFVEEHFRWEEHARALSEIYQRAKDEGAISTARDRINVMQMTDVTGRGGAEKALVDIAVRLDRSRYNVTVCATRSTGNYQPLLDAAGVSTFVQGRKSRWELGQWLRLIRLMRRERVDVLHTHLFGSNSLGRLLGRLAGVRVIIAHEHWSTKARREVWVDRLLYRMSDRILVPSAASKAVVMRTEGIPGRLIEVVYNGVGTAQFAQNSSREEVRDELGLPVDATVVGMVGRLSEEKGGVEHLIYAVRRLHSTGLCVRLLVVGDGPLRPALEAAALGGNTSGIVTFTGTRSDVPRVLGAMDIFALPSLNEALPIVVLEAMAAGLPVVATRVGGVPEIIEDGKTGVLVPPGSEDAIYSALHRLVNDTDLREKLARAGQAHIAANFSIERTIERIEALYEELLACKGKRKVTNGETSLVAHGTTNDAGMPSTIHRHSMQ